MRPTVLAQQQTTSAQDVRREPSTFSAAGTVLALVALVTLMACGLGCGPQVPNDLRSPYAPPGNQARALSRHELEVLQRIEERNVAVEDQAGWILGAQRELRVANLLALEPSADADLAAHLDNGRLYILVHPGYWSFFDQEEPTVEDYNSPQNGLDRLLAEEHSSPVTALIKAQEKLQRDFLEYMSTEKKLVLLVIPPGDGGDDGPPDYLRFLNEITNDSPSVVYVTSKEPSRGSVNTQTLKRIQAFVDTVNPDTIILGGGYAGRCVHDFQRSTRSATKGHRLVTASEITAISPYDMEFGTARSIMNDDGSVDIDVLTEALAERVGAKAEVRSLSRGGIAPQTTTAAK